MAFAPNSSIHNVLILGGGSAGFISALNIKRRNPSVDVKLIRSPSIKIIGVGESTIQSIPKYLHGYLGINPTDFFREVDPTWKLGIRFLWGPRKQFHYSFRPQVDLHYDVLPMGMGFYYEDEFEYGELASSLCAHDCVFARRDDGSPSVGRDWAYHLDNKKLVAFLEKLARGIGIEIIDDTVVDVSQDDNGITALNLQSRGTVSADLYVDCSGFRSVLLGQTLGETMESYKTSLYCDRAVVSEWERPVGELIQPYTVAETMNSGWCWQFYFQRRGRTRISRKESARRINRSYQIHFWPLPQRLGKECCGRRQFKWLCRTSREYCIACHLPKRDWNRRVDLRVARTDPSRYAR
jgi:tryptophan halogenase